MKLGDTVTIVQPSLFDPDHKNAPVGVIVRMPRPAGPGKRRVSDDRVMVKVADRNRPRPVRPEHLLL